MEKQLSPEKLLRLIVLFCLIGMGGSAIFVAGHVGSLSAGFARVHDLTSFFFTAIWIFSFFYAEYRVLPRFTKRHLGDHLGYLQSLVALALFLIGALNALQPHASGDVPGAMLFWMALAGEGVFILNVIWSYTHGAEVAPAATAVPVRVAAESVKDFGWPKSPIKLFGIGAAAFAAAGIISIILGVPSFKIPLPLAGHVYFLPIGCLWLAAAAPFGVFALLYKFMVETHHLVFEESLNRMHFVVTIFAVLDMVRVFMSWQQAMVSKLAELYFGPEFQWLAMFFGLSAAVFAINAYRSFRRNAART